MYPLLGHGHESLLKRQSQTRFHLLLSGQMLGWGMIATFQSFITNYASFLATRFLLGFFAAGYMPGK